MKKIILGIVFVFATVNMANANSNVINDKCSDLADVVAGSVEIAVGGYTDYGHYLEIWNAVDSACLDSTMRDLKDIQEPEE